MPPVLLPFSDFGGDWAAYERALVDIFRQTLANAGLQFRRQNVSCRRMPETDGQWFAYWHLIQEGRIEDDRTPDLRRCERLPWVRWVIENGETHTDIDVWANRHRGERNVLLWFREEYLVVLAQRNGYFLLKTAYCTEQSGRVRQLRKQRDAARP